MDENTSKIYTSAIGTAVTGFSYGSNVPMKIKSMTPTLNGSKSLRINTSNIINKNISDLNIQSTISNSDTVSVYVPLELCRFKIPVHPIHPAEGWFWEGPPYNGGQPGDQFIITFIDGDPTRPMAIRKV